MNGQTKAPDLRAKDVLREITTQSAEETIAFGRTLAELLTPPKLVLLRGDLGAGKTTLVKGIAAAFEAAAEEDVTSPTFTLVHEYRGPRANLYHIDLYRIDTPRELETLGLDDLRVGQQHSADRVGREVSAVVAGAGCGDRAGAGERDRTADQDQQLMLALGRDGGSENRTCARHGSMPFPHHREQNRSGEESEGNATSGHESILQRREHLNGQC